MQSTSTNITTICQKVGAAFETRYHDISASHILVSGVCDPLCLHLCSHWLMAGHRSRSRGLTRPETRLARVLFHQLAMTSEHHSGPAQPIRPWYITQLPLNFRKHCYALGHMAHGHGLYKIIMTMTQEFMMFLWVIPLAINLITCLIFSRKR